MKQTLLVKCIRYLVTCDDEDRVLENVNLYAEGGVIKTISPDILPEMEKADEVIDASGMVLYPGLINTHHHLYQTFSRNLPQVQNMELFDWLRTLYEIWKNLNEDTVYHSSLTGLAELLKTGCTTCLDHHYVFPGTSGASLTDAQFSASDRLGIRFHATRGSMDLSKKDGGLPPDSVVQTVDEILKDSERIVHKYHDRRRFAMHRVALAPCSPFSVSEDLLRESAKLARILKVRLHTHLAETRDEEGFTLERYGMRPLAYMERVGWVGNDVWYAHGIHFTEEELQLLADTGTGVAHCPVSNMKLSSGIANIPEMLRKGVPTGLAVDGSASNDGSSLLEEMRVGYLLHRLNSSDDAPSGYDMLKLATRGGAKILGRDDVGMIMENMAADFFLIDLNRPGLVGAQFDVTSLLSVVGYREAVDYTVVNGRVVVENGRLKNEEEEEISRLANASVVKYLKGK